MKFLFVGLGGIGQRHLRNLTTLLGPAAEIHAYRVRRLTQTLTDGLDVEASVDVEAKYDVRVHLEIEAALAEKPVAVFICNPTSLHVSVARAAVDAGCHLFVEKPLSHNMDGVTELIEAARKRGLAGLMGYQLRFHPCLRVLHQRVHSGAIGRPLAARVEVGEYLPAWHRYEDYRGMYASRSELGGGVILSQIHEMDYLYWLFGLARRVFSLGGHLSSLEIDVEDVASTLLEFHPGGCKMPVHLHQDFVQRPPSRTCTVIGDNGKIVMSLTDLTVDLFDAQGQRAEHHTFEQFTRNDIFVAELSHFLACIRGEETPIVSLDDGAQSLRMSLAAKESLRTGGIIEL